jgi:anti-sigma-K factor RskA
MLDDRSRELLTAYVDGELSARERKAVMKLLRRSPEARILLRRLQADSDALLELPAPPPAPDVTGSVMQAIAQRGLTPGTQRPRPADAVPFWKVFAAAAAVLIVVSGGSFLFFKAVQSGDARHNAKSKNPDKEKHNSTPRIDDLANEQKPPHDLRQLPPEKKDPPQEIVKKPDRKTDADKQERKPDQTPAPEPERESILAAPSMEVFQPRSADVAVPALFKLRELTQERGRQGLVQELAHSSAFYVEILCREGTIAFPRLQAALKAGGINVVVDQGAASRLKQPEFKTNYMVYLEDVTPEELAKILQPLGQEEPKKDKDAKKPPVAQFNGNDPNLILCPLTAEHRRKLSGLLGVDPRSASATGKSSEHLALAMVYSPSAPRQQSTEIKRYLESRKAPRKETLQVMLVLRGKAN